MGSLLYGSDASRVDFADRTLAHLQIVMVTKLRRHECFVLSFQRDGRGPESVWIHPAIPIRFQYDTPDARTNINKAWPVTEWPDDYT